TLEVRREGRLLQLNPTALKILQALMEASPAVVTRQELETRVWGEELPDSDSLRVHIHGLRAVVDKPFATPYIQTRHGIGYRIAAPEGGNGAGAGGTAARPPPAAPLPQAAAHPHHPLVPAAGHRPDGTVRVPHRLRAPARGEPAGRGRD